MKQNKLTKRDKILIYILKQNFYGYDFSFKDFSNAMVALGYAATKNALSNAISNLVDSGFLVRDYSNKIFLTAPGEARARHLVNYCMSQSDWAKIPVGPELSKNNEINKIDGTSSSKDLEVEIAKLKEENKNLKLDLDDINRKYANILKSMKDVEHNNFQLAKMLDSKKEIIDNLSRSLSETYAKLDKKNKENEYLTDILEKKLDAEKKMVAWTESIINGNAI